jgi:hypothetical protein
MTMQSSGPISIGQARNECGFGGQAVAGDGRLQMLAGVGGRIAWSQWYGKSNLPVINDQEFVSYAINIDRTIRISVNFRTGAHTLMIANGDHGPGINFWNQTMAPLGDIIAQYKSWSCRMVYVAGNSRPLLNVLQQPSPSNDYTAILDMDDNPYGGAVNTQYSLRLTCSP